MADVQNEQIKSLLKTHRDLDEETLDKMWEQAVFVFDSNVLLDLYRLPLSAKKELLTVLQNPEIKNRIWISFQGLLEFLNNRYDTISDQKNKFNTVRNKLNDAINGYNDVFSKLTAELATLKLRQRHSLIDPEEFLTPEKIKSGISFVNEFLDNLTELEQKQSDVHDNDDTKKHVLSLFEGKVGHGLSKEAIKKIYDEGEERYKHDIPPGYMDKKKNDFYTVLDIEYKCKFGDLLFWHEVIQKAKLEKLQYIILVTGDLKEDWWLEKRGKKLGPRKELLNEIYTKAPDLKAFHMYDTSNFLRRVGERFTVNVSESTISETENLLTTDRGSEANDLIKIQDVFEILTWGAEDFTITRSNSFLQLRAVNIPFTVLYDALLEIVHNAKQHGSANKLTVSAYINVDHITICFSNPFSTKKIIANSNYEITTTDNRNERGSGLASVKSKLAGEGIDISIRFDSNVFSLDIHIPLSKFG